MMVDEDQKETRVGKKDEGRTDFGFRNAELGKDFTAEIAEDAERRDNECRSGEGIWNSEC